MTGGSLPCTVQSRASRKPQTEETLRYDDQTWESRVEYMDDVGVWDDLYR